MWCNKDSSKGGDILTEGKHPDPMESSLEIMLQSWFGRCFKQRNKQPRLVSLHGLTCCRAFVLSWNEGEAPASTSALGLCLVKGYGACASLSQASRRWQICPRHKLIAHPLPFAREFSRGRASMAHGSTRNALLGKIKMLPSFSHSGLSSFSR